MNHICDNCLNPAADLTQHTQGENTWELCPECLKQPKRATSDLDLLQLSPDMFEPSNINVFFYEEMIGTIKEEKGIEPSVIFKATPQGVTRPITFGFLTKESALCHLLDVRKFSVEKKEKLTVEKSQLSMF